MPTRRNTFPDGANESDRLEALHSLGILDSPPDECFDRITSRISKELGVPISLVSLVDSERQWFKSNRGLGDCRETNRNDAFCGHATLPGAPDVMVRSEHHAALILDT